MGGEGGLRRGWGEERKRGKGTHARDDFSERRENMWPCRWSAVWLAASESIDQLVVEVKGKGRGLGLGD